MIMKHTKGHHFSQVQEDGPLRLLQATLLYRMMVWALCYLKSCQDHVWYTAESIYNQVFEERKN